MKNILFLLAMMCCTVKVVAQACVNYNQSNSQIPNDLVHTLLLGNNNDAWIGTDFGLTYFDGSTFTNYYTSNSPLPANSIRSLARDTSGTLWIGTFSNGLGTFDGTNWTLQNTANSPLPDDYVRSLAIDTLNQKWIGTTGGLAKIDAANNWTIYTMWNSILGSNNIASLYVDPSTNDKWAGTVNGGVLLIEKDTNLTLYTVQNSGIADNSILGIHQDLLGNTMMASPSNGLIVKLSGFGWLTYNLASSNIPTAGLTSLDRDAAGNPYMGTFDKGLLYKTGNNFIAFDTTNTPIADMHITCVKVEAGSGKVWVGTLSKGLYILDPTLLSGLENPGLIPNVTVYPNPADTRLHYIAGSLPVRVDILDAGGRLVAAETDPAAAVSVEELAPGSYLARFLFKNGSTVTRSFLRR